MEGVTVKAGVISIHAPAKGATWHDCIQLLDDLISIHAPAKGATPCLIRFLQ